MDFDTVKCGDYIRGLVLSPQGKAIRRIVCPVSVSSNHNTSTTDGGKTASTDGNNGTEKNDIDDDAPPLMDLVVKEVPFAATNRVFTVANQLGNGGSIIVKCFLPYYRKKPSVPLPLPCTSRAQLEYLWNQSMVHILPNKVSTILYYDNEQGIIVYERLETHVTSRLELTMGNRYPLLAEDMSIYFSRSLWYTSSMVETRKTTENDNNGKSTPESMQNTLNTVDKIIQQLRNVTFTSDITVSTLLHRQLFPLLQESTPFSNTHTKSTSLDRWESTLRKDSLLMNKLEQLSAQFQSTASSSVSSADAPYALIHGDLHTGNILTAILRTKPVESDYHAMRDEQAKFEKMTPEELEAMLIAEAESSTPSAIGDLRIIDSEYSGLGPIGYDLGTFFSHLIIALASGRSKVRAQEALIARGGYAKYTAEKTKERWATHCSEIATTIVNLWLYFVSHYIALWNESRGIVILPSVHQHTHDHNCCDHSSSNIGSSSTSSSTDADPYWKVQISSMQPILENCISYIGVEIMRRIFGALHVHDLESIESPIARAATEARLLSFGRYCVLNSAVFTKHVVNLSLQEKDRENGIQVFGNAFETLISGFAAMEGESGWTIIDKATPTTIIADDVLYPGRMNNRTVVVVDHSNNNASSGSLSTETKLQILQNLIVPTGYRKVFLSTDGSLTVSNWENIIVNVPISTILSSLVRSIWGPIMFTNVENAGTNDLSNIDSKSDQGELVIDTDKVIVIPPHLLLLKLDSMDKQENVTVKTLVETLIRNYNV